MQESSPIWPAFAADPPRRTVQGVYRVAVEALSPGGEAYGRVIEALYAPSAEEWTAVHGLRAAETPLPDAFTFVGALPGEIVELAVTWTLPRPGRKRARRVPPPAVRVRAVIESSSQRVTPRCPVFGDCGGCQLQQMDYAAQLTWKTDRVRTALADAGISDVRVLPAIGCEPPWEYRNHMRFSVNRDGCAGLTARGSHRVLPLAHCPIASPRINIALAALIGHTLPQPQALIRIGEASGELLLQPAPTPELRDVLTAAGLNLCDNALEEELLGARFRIRPSSFFQTNTRQANRMAALVLERLPAGPDTTLVDAYCGVGTFARLMAVRAGRVLAVEESASSIRDARWNLRDAANVEIVQAKVEDWLPGVAERLDGLVIDPPRAGCQRRVLDALAERRVPRVVYVSCDPDTLARDLAHLCQTCGAYRLVEVQPLDMFPQTAHIENIATLEAR
ncbi:MAG TPA: class I SAM-dependent RNA methyltransferase [Ktedonobacterales bacterium]|nr:class I SAM-dependent RNA methyltransferase [Ktedonobacterales bacterium]